MLTASPMHRLLFTLAGIALLVLPGAAGAAEEMYYVLVFGYETRPNKACFAHSFGTFVKVTPDPDGRLRLECHTISWLPKPVDVHLWRLLPEQGGNLDLDSSLRLGTALNARIEMWGPYRIEKALYDRAMWQVDRLERGVVRYKAIDSLFLTFRTCNCIHALSDVAFPYPRLRVGTPSFGCPASYRIMKRFKLWIIDPETTHDWIAERLGLDQYPIVRCRPGEKRRLLPWL
jgi:hypothetical protein